MSITFDVPIWNSEEGVTVFNNLSIALPPNRNIFNLATVSAVRLLVYLPIPICNTLLQPLEAMPLAITDELEIVRQIARARLDVAL